MYLQKFTRREIRMDVAQDTYKDKPPLSYQKKCVGITFFSPVDCRLFIVSISENIFSSTSRFWNEYKNSILKHQILSGRQINYFYPHPPKKILRI